MNLTEKIEKDYISAYKAKDAVRLAVLRLLKTAVKHRLVALCRPGGSLSDDELLDVFVKEAKQRQDSIEQYGAAGREDLADRERAELAVLHEYLPKPLTPEEIAVLVETAIKELSACSAKDMGKVISAVMAGRKGCVDGKILAETVKARLA
ncbi:MAG: GatB/YqeY domain-containing protein [Desulfovibrio sp.]|jgi:uncharacterized protein YqeY|nr:GatB/YqeY domain-containing protein [Desulfovibrio sp.]